MTTETATMIADAMVAADRESGDCTAEAMADPTAGNCENWTDAGIAALASDLELLYMGDDRAAVESAYARIWREAVEADAPDEATLHSLACDIAEALLEQGLPARELPDYTMTSDDERYVRAVLGGSASRSDLVTVEAAVRAYEVAR